MLPFLNAEEITQGMVILRPHSTHLSVITHLQWPRICPLYLNNQENKGSPTLLPNNPSIFKKVPNIPLKSTLKKNKKLKVFPRDMLNAFFSEHRSEAKTTYFEIAF